jgi:hypothetical protein
MTARAYIRGHLAQWDGGCWLYCDTGEPIDKRRSCARCGKAPTKEGHDACLGTLLGIQSACCGHGVGDVITMKDKTLFARCLERVGEIVKGRN